MVRPKCSLFHSWLDQSAPFVIHGSTRVIVFSFMVRSKCSFFIHSCPKCSFFHSWLDQSAPFAIHGCTCWYICVKLEYIIKNNCCFSARILVFLLLGLIPYIQPTIVRTEASVLVCNFVVVHYVAFHVIITWLPTNMVVTLRIYKFVLILVDGSAPVCKPNVGQPSILSQWKEVSVYLCLLYLLLCPCTVFLLLSWLVQPKWYFFIHG